jgi:catechol 2,3-dioxygenase-like lactoylglutathione lyase family enzyme
MTKCEITSLGIHLSVADIERSHEFYESLGFKIDVAFGDEKFLKTFPAAVQSAPERYRGISYKINNNQQFEIDEGHPAVKDKKIFKERISSPKISAIVRVKSLVPLFSNSLVNITFPVRHYHWGTIEAAFRDPDGFVLVFIADYSEEEFEKVSQFREIEAI